MAKSGRDLTIEKDGTVIAGARSKTVTFNNSEVDITNDDSNGFRLILDTPGIRSLDISIDGVWDDGHALQEPAEGGSPLLTDISIVGIDGTITGDFFLQDYEVTGEHDGEVEFSATMLSSGEFIKTPAGS